MPLIKATMKKNLTSPDLNDCSRQVVVFSDPSNTKVQRKQINGHSLPVFKMKEIKFRRVATESKASEPNYDYNGPSEEEIKE